MNKSKTDFTLILDAGGFSGSLGKHNQLRTEFLLQGLKAINYDAINLCTKDFIYGPEFILQMRDELKIPFVSANVFDVETGNTFVDPYIIKSFGKKGFLGIRADEIKAGIFGLTAKSAKPIYFAKQDQGRQLSVWDPIEAGKAAVQMLVDQVDIVICLAHISLAEAKTLAGQIPEIDLIILGQAANLGNTMLTVGRTKIVQAGEKGQYVGDLTLQVAKDDSIIANKNLLTPLDAKYPEDPSTIKLIAEYQKSLQELMSQASNQDLNNLLLKHNKASKADR